MPKCLKGDSTEGVYGIGEIRFKHTVTGGGGMTNSVEISVWRRSGRCIVDVGKDIK